MSDELNLEDIRKAVKILEKNRSFHKEYDDEGNWVEIDQHGEIRTMGLGDKARDRIRELTSQKAQAEITTQVSEVYGIKIISTPFIGKKRK